MKVAREVPYEEQTLNHPNPIARFAHRARYRNALNLAERQLPVGGTILDFGAGQGEFLHRLAVLRSDARLLAFEPYMSIRHPEVLNFPRMDEVLERSVDVLCAFETLEHVSDAQIEDFIAQAKRICGVDARIIVSVPVMQGAVLPVKELSKSILFRRFSDYSMTELGRGILGLEVRRAGNVLLSHKGFDHRVLFERLNREFGLLEKFYSPFRGLPWWCNSQAFFVFAVGPGETIGHRG